jgi:hypothetical protein
METLTYREDPARERWAPGPWDDEPDKVQFPDPETGLPCLAVRGPMGSWCGYVGVGPQHPWYRKDYSTCCTLPTPCGESYCGHSPEAMTRVHGGITFSGACHESGRGEWAKWRDSYHEELAERTARATAHPHGDAAEFLREWAPIVDDYDKWAAHMQATAICHVAGPGDFEPAWWFGFDCAHAGDAWPKRKERPADMPRLFAERELVENYRTLQYVKAQCAGLAKQLAAVAA